MRLLFNCTGTTVIPIVITPGARAAAGKPDVSKAVWFLATIKSDAVTSTSESKLPENLQAVVAPRPQDEWKFPL